jgi:hypothetical protein
MNHLSDEQLLGWLAGDADEAAQVHLRGCELCQTEAIAVRDGISRYSLALRAEAAQAQRARMAGDFAPRKAEAKHRLRWAGAGALALLLAAQTTWMLRPRVGAVETGAKGGAQNSSQNKNLGRTQYENQGRLQAAAGMSDDELLEAVNNDLSRDVPQALAPVSAITTERNEMAAASGGAIGTGKDKLKENK